MLKNMESNPFDVIGKLTESKFDFYLTGSRFFGTNYENSDWDFFAQTHEQIDYFLTNIGFECDCDDEKTYDDTHTLAVYYHSRFRIHVQIVDNAPMKNAIQQKMKGFSWIRNFLSKADKSDKINFWNFAFGLVEADIKNKVGVRYILEDEPISEQQPSRPRHWKCDCGGWNKQAEEVCTDCGNKHPELKYDKDGNAICTCGLCQLDV